MASTSDKTVNKIALCSAIFAGVAYVGYTYVRGAFTKDRQQSGDDALLEYEPHRRNRIFLRRLSGSDASSLLVGNGKDTGSSRLVIRPMTVQQRIRELNLRARHFAETVMAVHLHDHVAPQANSGQRAAMSSQSLQASPTRTPRCIDFANLASSRYSSTEDLSGDQRWARSSLRRKRNSNSVSMSREELNESLEAEGERLLDERESELRKRLQGFENGSAKVLTPYEAKSMVALLHTKDRGTLERALVTISNVSAFTANQDSLREAGCILRLQHLIVHSDRSVRMAAIRALGNLALNTANQKEMEDVVPLLLNYVEPGQQSTEDGQLMQQTLFTLTNIAALDDWHHHFISSVPNLLDLLHSPSSSVRTQSLRLLINLSTNVHMIQYLKMAKAPSYLWGYLDANQCEDFLLRVVTLLANILCSDDSNAVAPPTLDSGPADKRLFYLGSSFSEEEIDERLRSVIRTFGHDDIYEKATAIHKRISNRD